jgi:hypothetical protein
MIGAELRAEVPARQEGEGTLSYFLHLLPFQSGG